MPRKTLSALQQNNIVNLAMLGKTQKEIAQVIGCSARTVGRVLIESQVGTAVPRLQDEASKTMKVLKKYGIDSAEALDVVLKDWTTGQAPLDFQPTPVQQLNLDQVKSFLIKASHAECMETFYLVGLAKIAQQAAQSKPPTSPQQQEQKVKPDYANYTRTFPSYKPA